MADWTSDSSMGCEGHISSQCLSVGGFFIVSSVRQFPSALGPPVCMLAHIGTCKRLLTKQCSHSGLGVFVGVQTLFPFSGGGTLNEEGCELEGEEEVDRQGGEKRIAVVVDVVRIDTGPFDSCCCLSGGQVHPRIPSSRKDLVSGSDSLYWGHSRLHFQQHRALSCRQIDIAEACFHRFLQSFHELPDSRYGHHLP